MESLEALAAAREELGRRVREIGPGDWDRPTPCEDWTVRDLVRHVLVGARMTVMLLEGATREAAIDFAMGASVPDDVVAEFEAGADAQAAAFAVPGALDRVVSHPAGDLPATVVLSFRIGDATMHAWDLARAIGADETLNADLVAFVWEGIEPALPMMAASGMFGSGASGAVPPDAPLQRRLLDATGRRP
jgi:uncharacterized protein (TIGR03086 family)